jgi:hypothetical protein
LDPELGLTLKKVAISTTGNYRCVGAMGNYTDEKHFTISVKGNTKRQIQKSPQVCIQLRNVYIGIELTRIGEPDDPLEGSNITLICRTLFAEIKFPSSPEWAYQFNGTGKMKKINEMNPPEG